MSRLYVAYGSNLNKEQMKRRCPGAVPIGSGFMNNWKLVYRGSKTGSYATVIRRQNCMVPIGLWKITPLDEYRLDMYEGFPRFYQKQDVFVTLADGSRRKAMVYTMRKDAKPGMPTDSYVEICRTGYRDFGLNEDYLDESLKQ